MGTASYCAPEQLAGNVYDHRVDIYAVGIIVIELFVPFSTGMVRACPSHDTPTLGRSSSNEDPVHVRRGGVRDFLVKSAPGYPNPNPNPNPNLS